MIHNDKEEKVRKIRVLFAISNFTYGGIQTQALTLAKCLQRNGAKVFFLWTHKTEETFVQELKENNFRIIDGTYLKQMKCNSISNNLKRCYYKVKIVLLLKFYRINWLLPYQNELSFFFSSIKHLTRIRNTIFHIRNTVIENTPLETLDRALRNKPIIIANSNHARLKFQKVYGERYDLNIRTIHNGVQIREVNGDYNWKKYFDADSFDFIVTVVANFFKEKDFLTIFKAWKRFIGITESKSILLIAGDEGRRGFKKIYEDFVEENQMNAHVRFLGRISENVELLSIADCNILSSENEGLPNVAIETMALKKPLLATNVEGIREVVGDDYPIPLFNVGDYILLSELLVKVFNREFNREELEDYSEKRFQYFNTETLVNSYLNLLKTY